MTRVLPPALLLLVFTACGPRYEGAARADVEWVRLAEGSDCVRVSMTDLATIERDPVTFQERSFQLAGKGLTGTLKVGLAQPTSFGASVRIGASLHLGSCDAEPVALETQDHTFKDNELPSLHFLLRQPPDMDGGTDAGLPDAGAPDAGTADAGAADSGTPDAGDPDAGIPDAGPPIDAGPNCPNATVRAVTTTGPNWKDAKIFGSAETIIAVGDADSIAVINAAGAVTQWGGGTCSGSYAGVWVRRDGAAFAVSTTGGLVRVNGAQSCSTAMVALADYATSLTGYDEADGGATFFIGTRGAASVVDTASGTGTKRVPAGASAVWDVAAWDSQTVFAVGETSSGNKGVIWKWNAAQSQWDLSTEIASGNTQLYAVSIASPAVAFAGGNRFLAWNGATWSTLTSPAFTIYGLKAFSQTSVYAVGFSTGGTSFAHWDGVAWSSPTRPMTGSSLQNLAAADGCHVWAVGDNGFVVTNLP